jgi:hypothetical protein
LRVQLSEDGADAERLAELAGFLRDELLHLDIEDVTALRAGDSAPGTRAFDVAAVGGLLVGLGDSADGLRAVMAAIRGWLQRGDRAHRRVRLEIGGDVLELADATRVDQDRLVELFISRHGTGEGRQWTASAKP